MTGRVIFSLSPGIACGITGRSIVVPCPAASASGPPAAVNTRAPGIELTALVSIERIRACGRTERTKVACITPGRSTSSPNVAVPVMKRGSSLRVTRLPRMLMARTLLVRATVSARPGGRRTGGGAVVGSGAPLHTTGGEPPVCFAFDAQPPDLPADLVRPRMAGGAAAEIIELTSADGTSFSAALAESAEPTGGPAVIIFPDVRGLYRFYVELAERFAQAGHHAIAIDYFGRTAGTGERDEEFDFWPHVEQTRLVHVQADADAAKSALVERTGATSFVTVGFCFGGPPVLDQVGEIRCPWLGLFGGADEGTPTRDFDTFDRLLDEHDVEHEIVIYPDAPHSFFDRKYEEHAGACSDAWRRVISFLEKVGAARA